MNQFEEKLINQGRLKSASPEPGLFLAALHGRQREIKLHRYRTLSGFVAALVITVFGYFTFLQLDPVNYEIIYVAENDDTAKIFETDFWSINVDYEIDDNEAYLADLTLFLLNEDDLWETLDLIHDIYNNNEINNEETL